MRVSVIGGGEVTDEETATANELGRVLAERGHTVVCGGRGGTMEAVCRGATSAGGNTIGILPSGDRREANPYVDVAIATGLGHARNALVPLNGDGVVALSGSSGTLTEVGFASIYGRPTVVLEDGPIDGLDPAALAGLEIAPSPSAAVDTLERLVDGADRSGCHHWK